MDASKTLHWSNADVEVHKVVVGPVDNNVFVVRCMASGDAVLLDAANEHEQLLELCRALGVKRVLETHGHWDHIQAVPAMREAGYEVAVTALDAPKLKDVGYDVFIDDAEVIEVGRLRLHAIHNPGHTPGSISFHVEGTPLLFTGDTLFPGGPGQHVVPGRRLRHDHHVDHVEAVHVPRRHDRPARPRQQHDDRHRTTAPRRVDRTPLVTHTSALPGLPTRPHRARRDQCAHMRRTLITPSTGV